MIKYNGSEVRLRALSFENMDMDKIMRSNTINNCEDVEYLIGIPAKYRLKLGIHESGTTGIRVARDTKYLFVKNLKYYNKKRIKEKGNLIATIIKLILSGRIY